MRWDATSFYATSSSTFCSIKLDCCLNLKTIITLYILKILRHLYRFHFSSYFLFFLVSFLSGKVSEKMDTCYFSFMVSVSILVRFSRKLGIAVFVWMSALYRIHYTHIRLFAFLERQYSQFGISYLCTYMQFKLTKYAYFIFTQSHNHTQREKENTYRLKRCLVYAIVVILQWIFHSHHLEHESLNVSVTFRTTI